MDMHWPVRGLRGSCWPLGKWVRRRSRRGIEQGLIRSAGPDGFRHRVVDFEDDALGAVVAPLLHILALDDRERVHDVVNIVPADAVEMEEGGIKLATEEEAALRVPAEGRAVVPAISGERL